MTHQEALQVLDRVTSTFSGTRQDHINIQAAIALLGQLVAEKYPKPETQNEDKLVDEGSEGGNEDQ